MMEAFELVQSMAKLAKNASYKLSGLSTEEKNQTLLAMAAGLEEHRSLIKAENALDIRQAVEDGLSKALVDRLLIDDARLSDMIKGIKEIASLSDPVGQLITSKTLENGLELKKIRTPIGVIGIIFESRPNIIADVAALCLKSGNAVILRGGKEAEHSNRAIVSAINLSLEKLGFVPFSVQLIPIKDRECIKHLAQSTGLVDLIIPRGGEGLIEAVADVAKVPVIKHYKGVCHIYVDAYANEQMALDICHNAKCQRPGVCNAAETILVHQDVASSFLPKLFDKFDGKVKMLGCDKTRAICPKMGVATVEDWSTEYLDFIVSIKVVSDLDEAIDHINRYGSHHSDAIVSEDKKSGTRFVREVDSASVYINASTRFTDGQVFGLGAEMGISTDKLHARGPMGLFELTTYKWVGLGLGQIRS